MARGLCLALSCLFGLGLAAASAATPAVLESDEPGLARCSIDLGPSGAGSVRLSLFGGSGGEAGKLDRAALATVLGVCLGSPLRDVRDRTAGPNRWLEAALPAGGARRGWIVERSVRPAHLWGLLRASGFEYLQFQVRHPRLGFSRCPAARTLPGSPGEDIRYSVEVADQRPAPAEVVLRYGYRPVDLAWRLALVLLAAGVPIALVARVRRRSLALAGRDAAAAWFGFWRAYRWTVEGTFLAWLALLLVTGLDDLAGFVLGADAGYLWGALLVLPPAVVSAAGHGLSRSVWSRVRGAAWTGREWASHEFWRQFAILVPVALALGGLRMIPERVGGALLCICLALLAAVVGAWGVARATRMIPHALLGGELYDRVLALARQAGVKVNQIFLLPVGRFQLGNAFAARGRTVILTDYLLERLSRRETDGVVAHELAHLRGRHTKVLSLGGMFVICLVLYGVLSAFLGLFDLVLSMSRPGGAAGPSAGAGELLAWVQAYLTLPLVAAGGLLTLLFLARLLERSADDGAVRITGDPEGLIAALAKLSRMNLLPLQWGFWDESLGTHPSVRRRAGAIAAKHGVPPDRLERLLAPSPPDPVSDGYPLPGSMASPERLFTSAFRHAQMMRIFLILLLVSVGLPLAWVGLAGASGGRWLVCLAGFLAVPALQLLASGTIALLGYPGLGRALASRQRSAGEGSVGGAGNFVGLSPEAFPRLYEGHTVWDVGFLRLTPGALVYEGDQARFVLPRDRIAGLVRDPGFPGWWRVPDAVVRWTAPDGSVRTFRLHSVDGWCMAGIIRRSRRLVKELTAWRGLPAAAETAGGVRLKSAPDRPAQAEGPGAGSGASSQSCPPVGPGLPDFGPVSGQHPGQVVTLQNLFTVGLMVGLPILAAGALLEWPAAGIACALALAAWNTVWSHIPLLRYRDPE